MADSTQITRVQYAPYLERLHERIINSIRPVTFNTASVLNPFSVFTPWDLDQLYMDSSTVDELDYPKVFDLLRDHVNNLDLLGKYTEAIERSVNTPNASRTGTVINDMVRARQAWLLDEYDSKIEPRLNAGFRDLNSVMSSQYVIAKAVTLRDHERQMNDFTAQLQLRFAEYGVNVWSTTIAWHEKIPAVYSRTLAEYTAQRIDIEKNNFELASKAALWPYTVFGNLTSLLSAMNGATQTSSSVQGESPGSSGGGRIGGMAGAALSGAVAGSTFGPWGTGIGAVVGAIGGLFSS